MAFGSLCWNVPRCRNAVAGEVVAADKLIADPLEGTHHDVLALLQEVLIVRPRLSVS